jgi:UDP-2-acetamido-2-deoxy-ribo-hexuluronate aminotransferase
MKEIRMVDLVGQYQKIREEINQSIEDVILSSAFINGPEVQLFCKELGRYLDCKHIIPCANGTDALQVALMALDLRPGDEIITTGFTFIATLEVIALLGLTPVLVDVDPDTFNLSHEQIEKVITSKTRAIIPVHLFGQCSDMEPIMALAKRHNLFVIEDAAQAMGSVYSFKEGTEKRAGTIGDIGCTSFFPSKNLACYGDGGALITDHDELAEKLVSIVNHGAKIKYHHERVGVNSRLDSLQAAILRVKLKHIEEYILARQDAAKHYDDALKETRGIKIPHRSSFSTHVFHQYTLILEGIDREKFAGYLKSKGIPTMVYYPVPLHLQKAYRYLGYSLGDFYHTEYLCDHVTSLPMHTELENDQLDFITDTINEYIGNLSP